MSNFKSPRWFSRWGGGIQGVYEFGALTVVCVILPIGGGSMSRAYEVRAGRWHFAGEW